MFAGHLGAGLLLRRRGALRVNLGVLLFAAMLLDIVLWILVLAGVESLRIPPAYRTAADLGFDFPISHGLVASLIWSAAGAAVWRLMHKGDALAKAGSLVIAAAIFSHFALDWLVHQPELPLLGQESTKLGLGLWQRNLRAAWLLEAAILVTGLWLYLHTAKSSTRKKLALILAMVLVMGMTVVGQGRQELPPAPAAMAWSSVVFILLLAGFGYWVDRWQSV